MFVIYKRNITVTGFRHLQLNFEEFQTNTRTAQLIDVCVWFHGTLALSELELTFSDVAGSLT